MRGFLDVLSDFLAAAEANPVPTRIMYAADLNWNVLKRLVEYSMKHGYLEERTNRTRRTYFLTAEGREALAKLRSISRP